MGRSLKASHRPRVLLRGIIVWYGYNILDSWGIHWIHAGPNGGVLTRQSIRWYNINGVLIRTRNTQTFLHFRRLPWYMVAKK